MKKKIILLFLIVLLSPTIVLAVSECGTSTSYSGSAGSSYASAGGGSGSTPPYYSNKVAGLRFRLYKYDGKTLKALGNGVDIWNISATSLISTAGKYSSANTDFLNKRLGNSCSDINDYEKWSSAFSTSYSTYKNQKVYYDSSLGELGSFDFASWILTSNSSGEPSSGWLYTNLYSKIMTRSTKNDTFIKNLWGVSVDSLVKEGEEIYVAVEVLTKVSTSSYSNSTYGISSETIYYGGVSDFTTLYGNAAAYISLYNTGSKVGSLATNGTVSGTYKFKIVNPATTIAGTYKSKSYTYKDYVGKVFGILGGNTGLYSATSNAVCNNTIGMAVFSFSTQCPGCTVPACDDSDACGNITNGTSERRACAINWCNANGGDSNCVSDCSIVKDDTGCDTGTTAGVCSTQKTTKTGNVCSSNSKVVVEKSVCYDDTTSTSTLNDGLSVDLSNYVENLNIKYYRIDCTEKATLSNTANADTLLLTTTGTTDLYLGYTLGFYKTCTLTFKSTDGTSWIKDDYNQSKTSASDVSTSYSGNMRIIKDIITYYHYCDSNSCKSSVKTEMQDYANDLLKIYNNAKSRLDSVVKTEYTSGTTNQAVIDVINSSMTSTSTVTVDLEPAYCESNTGTSGGTSSFSGDVCYDGEKVTTTLSGSTSTTTCEDAEIKTVTTNTSGTEKTYSYTYYFTLPSSYISYSTSNVYHNASDCDKDAKASNGFCVEVENAYSFAPFTSTVSTGSITSGNYKISFSNLGTCKLSYNYTCSYDLEDSSYCSDELAKYTYGTEAWQEAFDKYCSCDVYCGSNIACRMKYCPDECDECDDPYLDEKERYCTLKDCDECGDSCEQATSTDEEYISCYFDNCCTAKCDGNVGCINNCCTTECGCLYDTSSTEYKTCITACGCPEGGCPEGEDYYYRSIDMDSPFPDGIGSSREPGYNWYNKVEIITESNDADSDYYDATDGRDTSVYEYEIYLSSSDIEEIKDSGYSTTYIDPNYSTKYKSDISDKVYCSEFLHDYLSGLGITVKVGNLNSSKGCEV